MQIRGGDTEALSAPFLPTGSGSQVFPASSSDVQAADNNKALYTFPEQRKGWKTAQLLFRKLGSCQSVNHGTHVRTDDRLAPGELRRTTVGRYLIRGEIRVL